MPVNELLFMFCLFGAFYGFLYPGVVGLVFGVCLLSGRTFRPRPGQWLPLLLPAASYYLLELLIARRQEWNMPFAVLALTAFASLIVIAARVARRPAWLQVGASLGVVLAVALWWLIPHQGWSRLF